MDSHTTVYAKYDNGLVVEIVNEMANQYTVRLYAEKSKEYIISRKM